MPARSRAVSVMIDAARRAGESLRRDFGAPGELRVTEKTPSDFVSSADLRSEALLREVLSEAYPDYDLMLEESAPDASSRGGGRFIVDPLDGTTSFLHGIPHFAVSIALEVDSTVTAGVVYDVMKDELFRAEAGRGAYLNDAPMSVSTPCPLEHAVIATGIPHRGGCHHAAYLAALERVMHQVAGIRRFGAAALDLCWVAAGRYDAFFELGLAPWDVAAGMLLVREAGGSVSRVDLAAAGGTATGNGPSRLTRMAVGSGSRDALSRSGSSSDPTSVFADVVMSGAGFVVRDRVQPSDSSGVTVKRSDHGAPDLRSLRDGTLVHRAARRNATSSCW